MAHHLWHLLAASRASHLCIDCTTHTKWSTLSSTTMWHFHPSQRNPPWSLFSLTLFLLIEWKAGRYIFVKQTLKIGPVSICGKQETKSDIYFSTNLGSHSAFQNGSVPESIPRPRNMITVGHCVARDRYIPPPNLNAAQRSCIWLGMTLKRIVY